MEIVFNDLYRVVDFDRMLNFFSRNIKIDFDNRKMILLERGMTMIDEDRFLLFGNRLQFRFENQIF